MKNPLAQIMTPNEQRAMLMVLGILLVGSALSLSGFRGAKHREEAADSLRIALQEDKPLKVDLRTAEKVELMAIPGIGEKRAEDIISYRSLHPFENVNELVNISGISEGIYNRSYPYLVIFGDSLLASISEASENSSPRADGEVVNVNTASSEELCLLHGIGPAKASAIISYRNEHGRFENPEDLMQVKGIGPKTIEKNSTRIRF